MIIYRGEEMLWFILIFVLSATAVLMAFKNFPNSFKRTIYLSVILAGIFNLFLNIQLVPELAGYQGGRQVLNIFNKYKKTESKLYNFETEGNEIFYYSDEAVTLISDWDQLRAAMKKEDTWLYTNEIKYNDILKMNFDIDTIYKVSERGMNHINLEFLNPSTRENSLKPGYLIVTSSREK